MRLLSPLAILILSVCAWAGEPEADSRIRRTQLEGAALVTEMTKEQIERTGIADIGDLISDGSSSVRFEIRVVAKGRAKPQDYFYDLLIEDLGERQLIRLDDPDSNGILAFSAEVDWGVESKTENGKRHFRGAFWVGPMTLIVRPVVGAGIAVPMEQIVWICFEGEIPRTIKGQLNLPGPNKPLHPDAACGRAGERRR